MTGKRRKDVPWEEKANRTKGKFPLELVEGITDTSPGLDAMHSQHERGLGGAVLRAAPEQTALIKN